MDYSQLTSAYEEINMTTKRLEKTKIISDLLKKIDEEDLESTILLLQGRVFPKWDERKIGISSQIALKSINMATGIEVNRLKKDWAKKGDLGIVIEEAIKNKKQTTLYHKKLTIEKVFNNIRQLSELEGTGTVSKKINLIVELLGSSSPQEAKYIVRTLIGELRIGIAEGVIRDSIVWTYFPRVEKINDFNIHGKSIDVKGIIEIESLDTKKYSLIKVENEKIAREIYNYFVNKVEHYFNLTNDLGEVALAAKNNDFSKLTIMPGKPINPMLAIKTESINEAIKSVGEPALVEYKYDGARLQIHNNGKEIKLFTRRLENVTKQFKELLNHIKDHVKAKNYILDAELVGFDPKTRKYLPFQNISQRIKRKHNIENISKLIPVEINIFDILYLDGNETISKTQIERRKILEKIIKERPRIIVLTKKLITSNEKDIENFYNESLKIGNEGIMIKNLESIYKPGRRVGGWVKHKPTKETLDLVIIEADWGEGKRANWLSSFTLACLKNKELLTIGKVGTGISEKNTELTFENLTKELKPFITKENGKHVFLKPKLILEIGYEEIQKSQNYTSGYALRFPKVVRIRYDLGVRDIDDLTKIEKIFNNQIK